MVSEKKETKLMLNNMTLADWKSMNLTECYFSLFHAWWHRGSNEIIGEHCRAAYFDENYFFDSLGFFLNTLGDGLDIKSNLQNLSYLRYKPGLHNLALMELFGFIRIEQDAALSSEKWPIVKIEPTTWGSALINYFSRYVTSFDDFFINEPSDKFQTESWGSELKTYISDWNASLVQPETVSIKDTVVIKVILGKVYRKIAIPSDICLDDLAVSILDAFDFSNDHLYEFIYKNDYGITERVVHPYVESDDELCTTDCVVGELPLYEGMELIFHFDFGDDWRFQLVVESIATEDTSFSEPKVIEEYGSPPEQYPDW
jgi:hypothetical protein